MKIHLLSGFLGSGKTTGIQNAARTLITQGVGVGVITNDQGIKLVDADFFKSLDIPGRQVANGCFCCNYNELDNSIESLIAATQPSVIFAESVGSCTDIVATVMKPLLAYRENVQVTVSVFADARLLYMLLKENVKLFDETVKYIYFKQLEETGIIVINKIDLMNNAELAELHRLMQERYSHKTLVWQNSLDISGVQEWLNVLDQGNSSLVLPSLDIDYDIYGAGEAMLAWFDQELEIYNSDGNAIQNAVDLANSIYGKIRERHFAIGHLKFLLNGETKISFTATSAPETMAEVKDQASSSAALLINARVQTSPAILSQIVSDAIEEIKSASGSAILVNSISSFQPGYPRPTHRMIN